MKVNDMKDVEQRRTLLQAAVDRNRQCSLKCRSAGFRSWDLWSCQIGCSANVPDSPVKLGAEGGD